MISEELVRHETFWAEMIVPVYYSLETEQGNHIQQHLHDRRFGAYVTSFQEFKDLLIAHDPEINDTTFMRIWVDTNLKLEPSKDVVLVESHDDIDIESQSIII